MTDPEDEMHVVYNYFEQEQSITAEHGAWLTWMDALMAHVKHCPTCSSARTYRDMCPTGKRTYDRTAEDAFARAKAAKQKEADG